MILRSEEVPGVILLVQGMRGQLLDYSALVTIQRGVDAIKLHMRNVPGAPGEPPRVSLMLHLSDTLQMENYNSLGQLRAAYAQAYGPDILKDAPQESLAKALAALTPAERAALFSPYCSCGQSKPCW